MDDNARYRLLKHLSGIEGAANMWKAGEALGMDRHDTENTATDLMAQGYLAIANLSGGVRVTQEGKDWLAQSAGGGGGSAATPDLGAWLQALEAAGDLGLGGAVLKDFRLDVQTLKLQMERSRALPEAVRACLRAIEAALAGSSDPRAVSLAGQAACLAPSAG